MTTGALLRGGLIAAIHTRSLRLTSRARATLTNGKLVTHVGTDGMCAFRAVVKHLRKVFDLHA